MDFLIELAVTSELEREEECWQWSVTVTLRPGRRRSRAGSGGRAWQQSGAGWGGGGGEGGGQDDALHAHPRQPGGKSTKHESGDLPSHSDGICEVLCQCWRYTVCAFIDLERSGCSRL